MLYMLDTNICIYSMKQHPPAVLRRFAALHYGDAVISVVTYAELRTGIEMLGPQRAQDEQALGLFIQRIPVLPLAEPTAIQYGILRAAVRDRRRDAFDRLIAAHALAVEATLVTNNEADFQDYPGLQLENWARES
jgi:tRNA(fMet)-specific endonuclease VapC